MDGILFDPFYSVIEEVVGLNITFGRYVYVEDILTGSYKSSEIFLMKKCKWNIGVGV